jgi:recombination protein U
LKRTSIAEYKQTVADQPDALQQMKGMRNRAAGLAFERVVIASCEYYKNNGTAFIEKTPEPMKIIKVLDRLHGFFKACFAKRAQPDFKGTLLGGRSICFEAKHTDRDRITQDAVTPEQVKDLNLHEELGALCFVLVSLGMQDFYRVPWADWTQMKNRFGHKYMKPEELAPYRVSSVGGNVLFLETPYARKLNEDGEII